MRTVLEGKSGGLALVSCLWQEGNARSPKFTRVVQGPGEGGLQSALKHFTKTAQEKRVAVADAGELLLTRYTASGALVLLTWDSLARAGAGENLSCPGLQFQKQWGSGNRCGRGLKTRRDAGNTRLT